MKIIKTLFKKEIEISIKEVDQLIELYQVCGYKTLKKFIDTILKFIK